MGKIDESARGLEPFARFVVGSALKCGDVCFCIQYVDEELLIPVMRPLVFIGKDLRAGDVGQRYFQDFESYAAGIRLDLAAERDKGTFECFPECDDGQVSAIYEFGSALNEMKRCGIRRREKSRV